MRERPREFPRKEPGKPVPITRQMGEEARAGIAETSARILRMLKEERESQFTETERITEEAYDKAGEQPGESNQVTFEFKFPDSSLEPEVFVSQLNKIARQNKMYAFKAFQLTQDYIDIIMEDESVYHGPRDPQEFTLMLLRLLIKCQAERQPLS